MLAGYPPKALWSDEILQLLETEHIEEVMMTHEVDGPEVVQTLE
jgi:hypothetical protein